MSNKEVFCRACGGQISFLDRMPVNEDGSAHWDICKARQFERVKERGTPYKTANETGFIYQGERMATWKRGPTITGSKYQPDNCGCGIAPWNLCKEDCAHQLA